MVIKSKPDKSHDWSKVNRFVYLTLSIPMVAINIPKKTSSPAIKVCFLCEITTKTSPNKAAINMSLEPNSGATLAIKDVIKTRAMIETMPPVNEDQ